MASSLYSASRASTINEERNPPQDELLDPAVFAENEVREEKEDPHLVRFDEGDPANPKARDLSSLSLPALTLFVT